MRNKKIRAGLLLALLAWLVAPQLAAAQDAEPGANGSNRPLRPMDAAETVLTAFDRVPLVALGEAHSLQTEHYFIQDLIRRPEFVQKTNDIVIEFANSRYQDVIDRYLNGENVPFSELSQVWRNTAVSPAEQWDAPVYENFLVAVRQINARLPAERKLRVWAVEPPIDWSAVSTARDVFFWRFQREGHIASVVKNQILSRGRKALMIYGSSHLTRKSARIPGAPEPPKNALQLIEAAYPNSTFIILPHLGFNERNAELEKKFEDWNKPSIALIEKTWLGRVSPKLVMKDLFIGAPGASPIDPWEGVKLEEIADAYLFMGMSAELVKVVPSPFIYRDDAYFNELNRRFTIMRGVPIDQKAPEYHVYGIPKLPPPAPPIPQNANVPPHSETVSDRDLLN